MKKIYLLAVLATLSLTGCNQQRKQQGTSVLANQPELHVRRASSGMDANGNSTITFNYTISPSGATDKTVIPVVRWSDANIITPIASYLSATSDSNNMTITVTCYQAFENQATLVVTSNSNSNLTSSITIDYEQKPNGIIAHSFNETIQWIQSWAGEDAGQALSWYYGFSGNVDSLYGFNDEYGGSFETITFVNTARFTNASAELTYSTGTILLSENQIDNYNEQVSKALSGNVTCRAYWYGYTGSNPSSNTLTSTALSNALESFGVDLFTQYWYSSNLTLGTLYRAAKTAAEGFSSSASSSLNINDYYCLMVTVPVTHTIELNNGRLFQKTVQIEYKTVIPGYFFNIPARSLSVSEDSIVF